MEEERLATYLKDRPAQLIEAKNNGVKIIGYFPGNYVPEEIIYASGAVPLCLNLPVRTSSDWREAIKGGAIL